MHDSCYPVPLLSKHLRSAPGANSKLDELVYTLALLYFAPLGRCPYVRKMEEVVDLLKC